jgi:hypothetical protein
MFSLVTIVAEFIGGGVHPYYRIDVFRLFPNLTTFGYIVTASEILFVASIFYYVVNLMAIAKKDGCKAFWNDLTNVMDVLTVVLSIIAIGLYVAKSLVTQTFTKRIAEVRSPVK